MKTLNVKFCGLQNFLLSKRPVLSFLFGNFIAMAITRVKIIFQYGWHWAFDADPLTLNWLNAKFQFIPRLDSFDKLCLTDFYWRVWKQDYSKEKKKKIVYTDGVWKVLQICIGCLLCQQDSSLRTVENSGKGGWLY